VWVGYPTANTPMHNINGVADVAGGTLPARIWHDVMSAASGDLPVEPFPDLLPLPPGTRSDLPVPSAPSPAAPNSPRDKPPKHGHGH
jgi:membrane peptidoglycan carboxypeptidase